MRTTSLDWLYLLASDFLHSWGLRTFQTSRGSRSEIWAHIIFDLLFVDAIKQRFCSRVQEWVTERELVNAPPRIPLNHVGYTWRGVYEEKKKGWCFS